MGVGVGYDPDADGNISIMGIYLRVNTHLNSEEDSGKVTKSTDPSGWWGKITSTCGFIAPDNQSSFEEGDSILFEATALDSNIDATELTVTFSWIKMNWVKELPVGWLFLKRHNYPIIHISFR